MTELLTPGTKVRLLSSAKRYHGGPAVVSHAEKRGPTIGYVVVRRGDFPGVGKRRLWVQRGEIEIETEETDR